MQPYEQIPHVERKKRDSKAFYNSNSFPHLQTVKDITQKAEMQLSLTSRSEE